MMSNHTSLARNELNKTIGDFMKNGRMSKNMAVEKVGAALGKLARRGYPYNGRYIATLSNGSKKITPAMAALISRAGGYVTKPKPARWVRQITFKTNAERMAANRLSMEECREALRAAVALKYGK